MTGSRPQRDQRTPPGRDSPPSSPVLSDDTDSDEPEPADDPAFDEHFEPL